ncbi:MAG: hypothetical protein ACRBEE_14385 [Arenicella sp.]
MTNKFIELNTRNTHYVLPWHVATVKHAIQTNNICANELCFDSALAKQQLSHDLFLLAAKDSITRNSNRTSSLALIARELMH